MPGLPRGTPEKKGRAVRLTGAGQGPAWEGIGGARALRGAGPRAPHPLLPLPSGQETAHVQGTGNRWLLLEKDPLR